MKILCLIDFSPASLNGVEYAAKLCQQLSATLTLLNIQKVEISEGAGMLAGGERPSLQEARQSADTMENYCREINKLFKISCDFEIIPTMGSFGNAVSEESGKFQLVIMGTNGADKLYEYYFGSHSFRVTRKSLAPVLIIPENYGFKLPHSVVFASGFRKGDIYTLVQLRNFLEAFKPELRVLHVSEKDTETGQEVFSAFKSIAEDELKNDPAVSFARVIYDDEENSILKYMNESNADLLALCYEDHSFFYRMLHKNLVKSLTSNPDFPVLVFHK